MAELERPFPRLPPDDAVLVARGDVPAETAAAEARLVLAPGVAG